MEHLNTSHVKVNLENLDFSKVTNFNLNTSHVKVNLKMELIISILDLDLNTSHVKVNRKRLSCSSKSRKQFKYISC